MAYEHEFSVDLTKLTEQELIDRKLKFTKGLYNGEKGSRDNVQKESLIALIDSELARRDSKSSSFKTNIALWISGISLLISLVVAWKNLT